MLHPAGIRFTRKPQTPGGPHLVCWVAPLTTAQREQWRINIVLKEKQRRAVWRIKLYREQQQKSLQVAFNHLRATPKKEHNSAVLIQKTFRGWIAYWEMTDAGVGTVKVLDRMKLMNAVPPPLSH